MLLRLRIVIAMAATLACAASSVAAQDWPQRPVRLILPLGAGSATDVTARLFADRLKDRWGRPVVVENRPGPDGIVAVSAFVAAHDEHTLLFSIGGPVTINPVAHLTLPYDPERDLVPIASASDSFLAIAVNPALGMGSVDELIAHARAAPGKLSWAATPGLPQFVFAGFAKAAGLDMVQVSYRDFSPAFQDLVEGRIQVIATALLPLLPFAREGKIKLLVVTNRERSPAAPGLATAREIGHPELAADGFQGFFGWRDMPESLRERIAADVRTVGEDDALKQKLTVLGQAVRTGTPKDFVAMIETQRAQIAAIARAIGLQKQ
ncbi:MAG TPA: tripartite tricarboxylate transporter substrate binding protein [Xanthobacteraceae bacterium]|nr:tripartite tricarboxylate transporter substrate binding protein [Xanthobacteraceae bacterium]